MASSTTLRAVVNLQYKYHIVHASLPVNNSVETMKAFSYFSIYAGWKCYSVTRTAAVAFNVIVE